MRLLHLYPNLMNLYGDYGNIVVLKRHLEDLGLVVEVDTRETDDIISFDRYDFVYIGSGTEDNQLVALKDLRHFEKKLKAYIESGKPMLLTGNAMELLGKSINDTEGLGILDFTAEVTDRRYSGDVIVHNDEIGDVVGFINKSSLITGGEDNKLFDYEFKDNNLNDNNYEGYRYNNVFGTHIIGPVLVKNPCFMNHIVKMLAGNRYKEIDYPYEKEAYDVTLHELRKRK